MKKILCHFLRRNRAIVTRKADPGKPYVDFNGGLYMLDTGAVNLIKQDDAVISTPELYYVEGNPLPLRKEAALASEEASNPEATEDPDEEAPAKTAKGEVWNTTPAGLFLDRIVIRMALENLEGPPSQLLAILSRLLKNPVSILIIAIAIVVVLAGIGGFFGI